MIDAVKHLFGVKTFSHGIHPPDSKDGTRDLPIRQFAFAPLLIVPFSQHIGKPAIPVVGEGAEVTRGQMLAKPDGFMSVAIHAPATGVISRIGLTPAINGKMTPGFFLKPYEASTQEVMEGAVVDPETATPEEILTAIQNAGVVGLGGAGFPTHAKLKVPEGRSIDTLILNGAECEPYLTTDHRVMLEHAEDVMRGIPYLLRATRAERVIIAVESNKRDAAESLRAAIPPGQPITVEVLPVKYPQGAEKMLTSALVGREIPSGGLPLDVGVICTNIGTTAEIGHLLPRGMGLYERVITVGGPAVKKKGNYRIPIGTPLRFILDVVGVEDDITTVVMGGPMMGAAASSLDISITKGSTGVIAFTERETGRVNNQTEYPCIKCGACVDACPIFLNPSSLGLLAEKGRYDEMVDDFHLRDCFECGCCTFVCPSHIPLVQKFRVAKAAVRKAAQVAK
ncbi:electron transport complex subunit RsxC [Novipirellula artificiosorum]|uniref:Ion-translocating oxidoreductase complex subunit C n=1 Tax=Novipirellula artificiosorum TaxID=2528016 RepID=A0A5C6D798_9BACT|nr:electron transport complex subunit RsxC [Novipirellula artificiosorum]TWU31577.1 Electron transport complex protein RnfC [Novipirellula artificiosorum]